MLYSGHGHITGGIVCFIHNHHQTANIVVAYQELLPWFTRMFLHTLKIENFKSLPEHIEQSGRQLVPSNIFLLFTDFCIYSGLFNTTINGLRLSSSRTNLMFTSDVSFRIQVCVLLTTNEFIKYFNIVLNGCCVSTNQ